MYNGQQKDDMTIIWTTDWENEHNWPQWNYEENRQQSTCFTWCEQCHTHIAQTAVYEKDSCCPINYFYDIRERENEYMHVCVARSGHKLSEVFLKERKKGTRISIVLHKTIVSLHQNRFCSALLLSLYLAVSSDNWRTYLYLQMMESKFTAFLFLFFFFTMHIKFDNLCRVQQKTSPRKMKQELREREKERECDLWHWCDCVHSTHWWRLENSNKCRFFLSPGLFSWKFESPFYDYYYFRQTK